jgi:hypothetical protein
MPSKHFKSFTDDRLVAVIKIDDEGKKRRAPEQHHITWQDGTERAISNPSWAYELRSICARSSAIEPNLTVPSGSLASIDPSV